jgi:GNAT superfamily N-acetyltransferase
MVRIGSIVCAWTICSARRKFWEAALGYVRRDSREATTSCCSAARRRPRSMERLWSRAVATSGNRSQMGAAQRLVIKTRGLAAVRPERPGPEPSVDSVQIAVNSWYDHGRVPDELAPSPRIRLEQPTIREFEWGDLPGAAAVVEDVYPERIPLVEAFGHRLKTAPERERHRRWIAEERGEIVGWGESNLLGDEPGVGFVGICVARRARRRGIGGALYEAALAHLRELGVWRVLSDSPDAPESRAFAERRGFEAIREVRFLGVDPRRADLEELERRRAGVTSEGLRLVPFTELRDRLADLYETYAVTTADLPGKEPPAPPFEEWVEQHWRDPVRSLDASFALVDAVRVVSYTSVRLRVPFAITDMTGTLREYRRRGYGYLVKLASFAAAAKLGVTSVITDTDEANVASLAMNDRLALEPQGASLIWSRE